jgi:hypothetical protein
VEGDGPARLHHRQVGRLLPSEDASGIDQPGPSERNLKIGTVLVRDYQGRRHTVTVESQGYVWEGQAHSSLSAIARAITGTAWSGPRFFALKSSVAQDAAQDRRAVRHHRQYQPSTGASKSRPRNPIRTY